MLFVGSRPHSARTGTPIRRLNGHFLFLPLKVAPAGRTTILSLANSFCPVANSGTKTRRQAIVCNPWLSICVRYISCEGRAAACAPGHFTVQFASFQHTYSGEKNNHQLIASSTDFPLRLHNTNHTYKRNTRPVQISRKSNKHA